MGSVSNRQYLEARTHLIDIQLTPAATLRSSCTHLETGARLIPPRERAIYALKVSPHHSARGEMPGGVGA